MTRTAARPKAPPLPLPPPPPPPSNDRGLCCRACGCRHFFTRETRKTWGNRVRRRRECRNCGVQVVTYESMGAPPAPTADA